LRRRPEGPSIQTPLQVGKYLVSPLTRATEGGRYAAAVSIRSGHGSGTHDRVLRFAPRFDGPDQAARYAMRQALAWIGRATAPATPKPNTQE
jgi:hypothetical protein